MQVDTVTEAAMAALESRLAFKRETEEKLNRNSLNSQRRGTLL